MNITNLCRSCMKELTGDMGSTNGNINAIDMFSFCTNIQITDEDKLPKQFCSCCITKIESSYAYIVEARRVDITLKNLVSRSETSVIVQLENHKSEAYYNNECHSKEECNDILNYEDPIQNESTKKYCTEILKDQIKIEDNIVKEKEAKEFSKSVNDSDVKNNFCPICRKGFVSMIWFSNHMEKEHGNHSCDLCSKTFTRLSQLTSHMLSHSTERNFECTICGKCYKSRKQLTIHVRKHSNARPFECDKCAMRFKCKNTLKCHLKVHEGTKPYLCSFCGLGFAQAGNLCVHSSTHTGIRPHKCPQCPYSATCASNLARHLRGHSGERMYKCRYCHKGFIDAAALTRHTRIHTGELPYRCPLCARAFLDSWKRKTHLMRAHKMSLEQIPRMNAKGEITAK